MLAESAARAGVWTVALDHYADADTRASAAAVAAIPEPGGAFDREGLLTAAARLAPPDAFPLIYGSGLDSQPDLLNALAQGRAVIGNPPPLQGQFREPSRFFALLRQLEIPHPEIRAQRPPDPEGWLLKSGCSEGGKRVRFCAQMEAGPQDYYQWRLTGPAFSALFLADGQQTNIIGFNTLWTAGHARQPFLFGGAISHAPLRAAQRRQVVKHVASLVQATGLRGLNSLDFMLDAAGLPLVLEINARPSATLALYDADYPEGLLAAHYRACHGHLQGTRAAGCFRAFRVVLAPCSIRVPPDTRWPAGCADRPVAGTVIAAGQALCTATAAARSPSAARARIEQLTAELHRLAATLARV